MRQLIEKIEPRPRRCSWEITLACNLNCVHCGSSAGAPRDDELPTSEALSVCDQLADLGCREATLLGGEPFLRKDWDIIAQRLIARKIDVNIVSNGYLIDSVLAAKLNDIGIRRVGISIDGLEKTHDRIRGNGQSFSLCNRAIDQLLKQGISVCAITVVMPQNIEELEDLLCYLTGLGVRHWQIQLPVPKGRFEEHQADLSHGIVQQAASFISSTRDRDDIRVYAGCNIGYFGDEEENLRTVQGQGIGFWTGCYAGVLLVAIRSNGDVTGCLTMPEELTEGNVREKSLPEIWNAQEAFSYHRGYDDSVLTGYCASCEFGQLCRGGCRTMSYYSTGSLFDDPHCCFRILQESAH